jgi:hypothetical protein
VQWVTDAPAGEWRMIVTISSRESNRIEDQFPAMRGHLPSLHQFLHDASYHHIRRDAVLAIDNLELFLHFAFNARFDLVTITPEEEK